MAGRIQTWSNDYIRLLNKPYENEVTLIRQNPHQKYCLSLEVLTQLKMGLDLLFEVCRSKGCKVTGLQTLINSTPDELEPRLITLAHNLAGMAKVADFFLRTPTLKASNFAAL